MRELREGLWISLSYEPCDERLGERKPKPSQLWQRVSLLATTRLCSSLLLGSSEPVSMSEPLSLSWGRACS